MRYLHYIGHRKIGHVTGPEGNVLMHAHKSAFIEEIGALQLEQHPEWIIPGDFSLAAGCLAAQTWIALENRPTAMFCASDQLEMGFISELLRPQLQSPRRCFHYGL